MSRFLLTGPEKIGKSVAANRIANALGCASIKYEWDGVEPLPDSVLAIATYTNLDSADMEQHLKTMPVFIVNTSDALQALVEALEYQQVTPKQFHAAKKLADIAAWLDGHKSYLGSHAKRQEASDHIDTLHNLAMNTAAYRIAEIYSPEDGAQA